MHHIKYLTAAITCLACLITHAISAWEYPDCQDITGSDFRLVPLATLITKDPTALEPLKLALDMDDQGVVTVYWIERLGQVKRYITGGTGNAVLLGKLEPATGSEDGLVGIALDPGFKENRWMYLMYSLGEDYRISRFTLAGNSLDLSSEKILILIPSVRSKFHTGGGMAFDDYGDLWITVGDNQTAQIGASNTADLRGGILRIHPDESAPGGYTIPEGNYWEYGAAYFRGKGKEALALEYEDPHKVKRELYAKGMRNPYTIGLDPVRRWATYGDCGPDHIAKSAVGDDSSLMTEEHSLVLEPGFFGWPYWSGINNPTETRTEPGEIGPPQNYHTIVPWEPLDMAAPVNNHPDANGVSLLTPHVSAQHTYPHACAVGAIIPRYFPRSTAPYKLPPHLHHKWLVLNLGGHLHALNLNDQGEVATPRVRELLWGPGELGNDWGKYLDLQQGPDGAIYLVAYNCRGAANRAPSPCTGIWRIEYTGPPCEPADFKEEIAGCMKEGDPNFNPDATHHNPADCNDPSSAQYPRYHWEKMLDFHKQVISVNALGSHQVIVSDIRGRRAASWSGEGKGRYTLGSDVQSGVYIVSLRSQEGNDIRKIVVE